MRLLLQFVGIASLLFLALLGLYGASAFVYNQHIVNYQLEIEAWPDEETSTEKFEWKPDHPKRVRILALEGGALLGLAELEVLKAIEETSGKRIYELFDFVAGASTGTIISTLLFRPKDDDQEPMTADDAIKAYSSFAAKVLDKPTYHKLLTGYGLFGPRMQNKGRIEVAKRLFGNAQFKDLLRPAMFPGYSQKEGGLRVFRSWDPVEGDLYLHALLTAITSVQTYFPAIVFSGKHANGEFISDAGMILDAPGEMAYLHARTHLPEIEEFVVVSVGTKHYLGVSENIAEHGGLIQWANPLVNMALVGESSVSAQALQRHSDFDSSVKVQVFFLAPEVAADLYTFDPSPDNVAAIRKAGRDYTVENQDIIKEVVLALDNSDAQN